MKFFDNILETLAEKITDKLPQKLSEKMADRLPPAQDYSEQFRDLTEEIRQLHSGQTEDKNAERLHGAADQLETVLTQYQAVLNTSNLEDIPKTLADVQNGLQNIISQVETDREAAEKLRQAEDRRRQAENSAKDYQKKYEEACRTLEQSQNTSAMQVQTGYNQGYQKGYQQAQLDQAAMVQNLKNALAQSRSDAESKIAEKNAEIAKKDAEIAKLRKIIESMSHPASKPGPPVPPDVPAAKPPISRETFQQFLETMLDTGGIDSFFENRQDAAAYQKMLAAYKRELQKCVRKLKKDEDEDLEISLSEILGVVHDRLLLKAVVPLMKKGKTGSMEAGLLERINTYLSANGFRRSEDIFIGKIAGDEDFAVMDVIPNKRTKGRPREVVGVDLYPYILDYVDEDGTTSSIRTKGRMILIPGEEE